MLIIEDDIVELMVFCITAKSVGIPRFVEGSWNKLCSMESNDYLFLWCAKNKTHGCQDAFSLRDVLEHFELEEITPIFRNVWRVLKPGGRFLNIVPNKKGYDYGLRINAGHKHFVTVEEIASVAKNTGFRLIEHYPSPFPRPFDKLFTHNKIVTICEKSR